MGLRTHADTSALAGAMAAAPEELRENKFAAYKKWSVEGGVGASQRRAGRDFAESKRQGGSR